MRALAVSSPNKIDNIPTLKDQGIDVVLGNWRGVFAAPGISTAQRDALVTAVKTATESPAWKESLTKFGWDPWFLAGDQYKAFLEEDVKRISAIIDSLGLKK
jgi:putative tricarboxylic transport membrane protein